MLQPVLPFGGADILEAHSKQRLGNHCNGGESRGSEGDSKPLVGIVTTNW